MCPHDDKRQAYLDGELSPEEAHAFEQTMPPEQVARLTEESRLNAALSSRLNAEPMCPDELWKRVRQDVWRAAAEEKARGARWLPRVLVPATVAAVALIAAMAFLVPAGPGQAPPFLDLAAADEREAEALSEVESNVIQVESYLRQAGMALRLTPEDETTSRHPIHLVGARQEVWRGKTYVRIFYQCCRTPVEVIVAQQGDPAAEAILGAQEHGRLATGRTIGTYVIAVVGVDYHSAEVLELLRPD